MEYKSESERPTLRRRRRPQWNDAGQCNTGWACKMGLDPLPAAINWLRQYRGTTPVNATPAAVEAKEATNDIRFL